MASSSEDRFNPLAKFPAGDKPAPRRVSASGTESGTNRVSRGGNNMMNNNGGLSGLSTAATAKHGQGVPNMGNMGDGQGGQGKRGRGDSNVYPPPGGDDASHPIFGDMNPIFGDMNLQGIGNMNAGGGISRIKLGMWEEARQFSYFSIFKWHMTSNENLLGIKYFK